ncbi:HOOK protein [Nesidiocoris tenuis]|uniref:HOOK protein n=1 Tax=Nesidiocoris tenuis TaxID=355587 RepID=A0ABN7BAL7_9HEMI|nr:HOOK protein [Nesidiocoris tenuis]
MSSKSDLEEFLDSPLVTWVKSCLHNPSSLTDYDDLVDGHNVYQVLLLIDPEPLHHGVRPAFGDPVVRTKNWDCIIKNIKALYEEELCQLVLILPDPIKLGRESETKSALEEMQLVLQLLLGCAVQCPNKQVFIERIKELPIDAQHALVDCIKQVTESQEIVLTPDAADVVSTEQLLKHLRRLLKVRDQLLLGSSLLGLADSDQKKEALRPESQHLAVELADWKAKLRKHRQEVEEKSEALSEAKEELEFNKNLVSKLKQEINELKTEARVGKAYRDEADALRERAERADRLEAEVLRYREKLSDLEYYRSRVEEMRQDKRVLEETREMLEEQLSRARTRVEHTQGLESSLMALKQTINDLSLEREATQEKVQELMEENAQLALLSKSALNHSSAQPDDSLVETTAMGEADSSLSEQLSSSAQARALRLELENRRLAETVESLQEAALLQTNERILQLEKDKKKLSLQVAELDENKRKLQSQINELETTVKNAQRDTKKMQDIRDSLQSQLQLRVEEVESVSREKLRLESRTMEAEEKLRATEAQLEKEQDLKAKYQPFEKEVQKLKEIVEAKSVDVDHLQGDLETALKEKAQLAKQLEKVTAHVARLSDVERDWKDLESKYLMDKATINTLQNNLVQEKLVAQQLKASMARLGLAVDQLGDPDSVLDKMLSNAEIVEAVKEKLATEGRTEGLQEENARLSVTLSTLQSQVTSLNTQHTAQKLANSQLVAEKEELSKRLDAMIDQHQQLLVDHLTLQSLHEQLTAEYEALSREKENIRGEAKRARNEARELRETEERLQNQISVLMSDVEKTKVDSSSLANLRHEHSKLKEDFRNLFTASEKMKSEFKAAQDEYKSMNSKFRTLSLEQTEVQGELSAREENIQRLEVQVAKLTNDNQMLSQMAQTFEEDRKSLMEHVTLLLQQYHSLLTHSLDDKEHYHAEEKLFNDRLNHLSRQKEKLEEKIMEQIRNMGSQNTKKKGSVANLFKRIRKSGSELINKAGRRSWHEDAIRRGLGAPVEGNATDSDTSLDEVRSRQDGLGLGTAGTRRTVYLSGDEGNTNTDQDERSQTLPADIPRCSTPHQDPSVLVYNRVTAVIGDNRSPPGSPTTSSRKGSTAGTPNKKANTWYEYGCV